MADDKTAPTLTESINAAREAEDAKSSEVVEESKTEVTEEKKEETQEEKPPTKKDYGLSELEAEQALQMMAVLKDPEQAPGLIDFIARKAGYDKVETKQEVKEAKKDITAALKEALGGDLDYIAEKIGPVIDNYVKDRLAESTEDIRQRQEQQERANHTKEATVVIDNLAKEVFNADTLPDNVMAEMSKLMDRYPPEKNSSTADYIKDMLDLAMSRLGVQKVDKQQETTRNKNRTDAPSRLASGGGKAPIPGPDATKFTTLDAAVKAAVAAQTKE